MKFRQVHREVVLGAQTSPPKSARQPWHAQQKQQAAQSVIGGQQLQVVM